jgi:hypothetical protein
MQVFVEKGGGILIRNAEDQDQGIQSERKRLQKKS